ncbi:SDR family NAD(P)-dependent oxidoreductase [Lichenifustis flavocetrariae]|uniref:SDR family oxidoreductase n=1 Tax=Lichenifustis flavocetrariae TaxID=2949735 RepID=A0AA42CP92_9HYPH|nr:SDR family NAD(P)-dependent oxidoreductase [Lichenifustis flavocetrariae]MCW6510175.1 SDR family oxidoreductase [Lichenifustis flavocetrariae]
MNLHGRTALVTGAQKGIGRASALMLAEAGADIVLHYLDDPAATESLAGTIVDMGRKCATLQADLRIAGAAGELVEAAWRAMGPLHIVVNNAGIFHRASLAELSHDLWDLTLDVNLRASTFVIQAAVAQMRAEGIKGAIVNVSSVAAYGTSRGVHYSASKGGMDAMTRAVAMDVARDGIRVNAVAPGMILTDQALEGHALDELRTLASRTLPGRLGSAEEVAGVIAFLVSDAASFVNGEIIAVNGGAHMA